MGEHNTVRHIKAGSLPVSLGMALIGIASIPLSG